MTRLTKNIGWKRYFIFTRGTNTSIAVWPFETLCVFSSLGPSIQCRCSQAALGELRQVHINLKDAEKGRERALVDSEQAKNRFAGAEKSWRREVDDLRVALKEALAKNYGKDEGTELSRKDGKVLEQSEIARGEQPPPPQRPEGAASGFPAMTNEDPQPSTSVVSDATSEGLAEGLLQKLTDETKQRRSTRQALSDKVRFLTQFNLT